MDQLIASLKTQLIEQLNLEDNEPEDIQPDEPLFGPGLGLDSIDALEIIVLLEREYGLKITDQEQGKKVFHSIRTIAEYIKENTDS